MNPTHDLLVRYLELGAAAASFVACSMALGARGLTGLVRLALYIAVGASLGAAALATRWFATGDSAYCDSGWAAVFLARSAALFLVGLSMAVRAHKEHNGRRSP